MSLMPLGVLGLVVVGIGVRAGFGGGLDVGVWVS
jgi:hypothetical protein